MPDYEFLELLLFHAVPRRDTKPLAKRLIDRFGSLATVLAADSADISKVTDSGPAIAGLLKAVHQAGPAALSCEDSSSGRKGYGRGQ